MGKKPLVPADPFADLSSPKEGLLPGDEPLPKKKETDESSPDEEKKKSSPPTEEATPPKEEEQPIPSSPLTQQPDLPPEELMTPDEVQAAAIGEVIGEAAKVVTKAETIAEIEEEQLTPEPTREIEDLVAEKVAEAAENNGEIDALLTEAREVEGDRFWTKELSSTEKEEDDPLATPTTQPTTDLARTEPLPEEAAIAKSITEEAFLAEQTTDLTTEEALTEDLTSEQRDETPPLEPASTKEQTTQTAPAPSQPVAAEPQEVAEEQEIVEPQEAAEPERETTPAEPPPTSKTAPTPPPLPSDQSRPPPPDKKETHEEGEEVWVVSSSEMERTAREKAETASPQTKTTPPSPGAPPTGQRSKLVPPLTQTLFTELLDQRVAMALRTEAEKTPEGQRLQRIQQRFENLEARMGNQLQEISRRFDDLERTNQNSTEAELRSVHIQFREVIYREDRKALQQNLMEMMLVTGGVLFFSALLLLLPYEFFSHIKWSKLSLILPLLFTGAGITALEVLNQRRQVLEERIATRERHTGLPTLALPPSPLLLFFARLTLGALVLLEIALLLLSNLS